MSKIVLEKNFIIPGTSVLFEKNDVLRIVGSKKHRAIEDAMLEVLKDVSQEYDLNAQDYADIIVHVARRLRDQLKVSEGEDFSRMYFNDVRWGLR